MEWVFWETVTGKLLYNDYNDKDIINKDKIEGGEQGEISQTSFAEVRRLDMLLQRYSAADLCINTLCFLNWVHGRPFIRSGCTRRPVCPLPTQICIETRSLYYSLFSTCHTMSKVVLITGGSAGLGRGAARKLLQQNHTVVITGRTAANLESAKEWITKFLTDEQRQRFHAIQLDLSSLDSVRQAVQEFKNLNLPSLDILINNAGGTFTERELVAEETTPAIEKTIFVNAVAPWYLTMLLLPIMKESPGDDKRILFVTSSLHDPTVRGARSVKGAEMTTDLDFENLDGHKVWDPQLFYRISKLTQLWLAFCLAEKELNKIQVLAFCPGFVPTTSISRNHNYFLQFLMKYVLKYASFATSEDDSTDDYVYYATSSELKGITGAFYRRRQKLESSEESRRMDKAKKFWNMACDICTLPDEKYT